MQRPTVPSSRQFYPRRAALVVAVLANEKPVVEFDKSTAVEFHSVTEDADSSSELREWHFQFGCVLLTTFHGKQMREAGLKSKSNLTSQNADVWQHYSLSAWTMLGACVRTWNVP